MGLRCTEFRRDPDPGRNYQATVKNGLADAMNAGFYVIPDLHQSSSRREAASAHSARTALYNPRRYPSGARIPVTELS